MAEQFVIKRAERAQVRLRLALQSPSGGGKTGSALLLAKGMVDALRARGKLPQHLDVAYIGVIDTERDSASLYSDRVEFDTLELGPPYSPSRYMDAITQMVGVGYPIIILDQITHEWFGQGGVLQMVAASKASNDWAKWNGPSQEHDAFIDAILNCPAHIIATMRSKTEYVLEKNDKGKMVPVRIGMQAKQREGTEYEFTTVLDLETQTNQATCHKDRTGLFVVGQAVSPDSHPPAGYHGKGVGYGWGVKLIDWVYSAQAVKVETEVMPAVRARGMAEAAKRAIERTANMGDLELAFIAGQKSLRAFAPTAGRDVIEPLLAEVVAAKDKRKEDFKGKGAMVRDLDPAALGNEEPPPPLPSAIGGRVMSEIVHNGGGFEEFKNDLPWEDETPPRQAASR